MPDVLSQDNDVLSSFFTPSSPMMTTTPSEPPPAAPVTNLQPQAAPVTNLQPQIDALRRRSDAAIGGVKRSMAEEEQTAAAKQQAMEPLRQRQMALVDRNLKQLEQPPPKAQQPPATPQRQNQHDDENWLFAASLLGALAGGLTRRHMTNALGAFSGAMEGYQEGSRQKFDQNMKIWEVENKKIQETNKTAMDEYRSVLENTKLSQDQMSIALQLAAAKYDDKAMAESAKTKNFFQIAQHYDKEAQALEQLDRSHKSLSESRAAATAREQEQLAIQYVSRNQPVIDAIIRGDRAPPPVNPRTGLQGAIDRAMTAAIYAQAPDFQYGQFEIKQAAKKAEARVRAQTDAKLEQGVLLAFGRGPEARSVRSLNVAIAHLDTLEELGRALGNSDFPRLNQLANRVEIELGYPMPKSFDAAKQIVSAEILKSVVPTGGGVYERQEAANNISNAASWDQLIDVTHTYKSLLGGQMKGLQKQYEHNTKRTDFLDMLEPETVKALSEAGIAPTPSSTPPGYRKTGDQTSAIEQAGKAVMTPMWESPLPQWIEDKLPAFMHPRKPVVPSGGGSSAFPSLISSAHAETPLISSAHAETPNMPIELPEGWSVKELQ